MMQPAPDGLREIGTSEDIDFEGEGEILRVAEKPTARRAHASRSTRIRATSTTRPIPRYRRPMSSSGPAPSQASSRSPSTTGPIPTGRRRSSTS